jgi:hypothetical protein
MNSKILMSSLGAVAALAAGVALAAGSEVATRSVEDANADLMRTYTTPGGPPAGQVMSRSADECYADLMRDWDGKLTKGQIVGVGSSKPIVGVSSSGPQKAGRQ